MERKETFEHLVVAISEMYDVQELRDSSYMFGELGYLNLPEPRVEMLVSAAKKRKRSAASEAKRKRPVV